MLLVFRRLNRRCYPFCSLRIPKSNTGKELMGNSSFVQWFAFLKWTACLYNPSSKINTFYHWFALQHRMESEWRVGVFKRRGVEECTQRKGRMQSRRRGVVLRSDKLHELGSWAAANKRNRTEIRIRFFYDCLLLFVTTVQWNRRKLTEVTIRYSPAIMPTIVSRRNNECMNPLRLPFLINSQVKVARSTMPRISLKYSIA